jgi:SpoVK/Ycf46/Vps4 family AAA+-type ATPase
MTEMQGVGDNASGVLVLAATNCPYSLDAAFRRRFQKRVYIPLPDEAARRALFQINLGGHTFLSDAEFGALAAESKGFSGSDIAIIAAAALQAPVDAAKVAWWFTRREGEGANGAAMWEAVDIPALTAALPPWPDLPGAPGAPFYADLKAAFGNDRPLPALLACLKRAMEVIQPLGDALGDHHPSRAGVKEFFLAVGERYKALQQPWGVCSNPFHRSNPAFEVKATDIANAICPACHAAKRCFNQVVREAKSLKLASPTLGHCRAALKAAKPTVSPGDLAEHEKYTQEFGLDGS